MPNNLASDQSSTRIAGRSCPLCWQVEDEAAMVAVTVPWPRIELYATVLICHGCASAIAGRMLELEHHAGLEPEATEMPSDERPATKAKSRKRKGRAAEASDGRDPDAA
jgi:hypothetical protein